MSLRRQVVHALSWTAGAKLAGQLFTWGVTIVVMRLLDPEDYGLMAMGMIFVAFFQLFDEIGLLPALVQSRELPDAELKRAFGTILLVDAIFFVALWLVAPLISAFFGEPRLVPVICALATHFLLKAVMVVPDAMMQRRYQLKTRALVDFASATAASLVTLLSAWSGLGVWALVIGFLTGGTFRAVAYNVMCPYFVRPVFALPASKSLVRFGVNTLLSRMAWFLYSQADIFIGGKMLGKEALGYYSVAMHWASLPVHKTNELMYQVIFPTFARIQADARLVAASTLKGTRILSLMSFPVLFGMSSVADELVLVLLGPKWESAAVAIQLLALIMPLRSINSFILAVADGVGRSDVSLRSNVVALLILPPAMLLASNWGLLGFCAAWLAAYPIVFAINAARILPVVGVSMGAFLGAALRPAVAAAGMYLAVSAARLAWPWENRPLELLVFLVLVGVLSYGLASVAGNRRGCIEAYEMIRNRQ